MFGSSPVWQAVCEFSFCRSEAYILHYQTFGQIFRLSPRASTKTGLKVSDLLTRLLSLYQEIRNPIVLVRTDRVTTRLVNRLLDSIIIFKQKRISC